MMLPTPCYARFRRFGDRWFAFNGTVGTAPIDALQLVIDAPEFLGAGADQSLPRAAAPAQSQSSRVLVVVDDAGGVQLAVCPEPDGDLAMVVGDLLATGRRFWRKDYEALAGPFQEFLGTPLTDWIAGRAGDGWSVDKFRAGLEHSLSQGRFPITIVINELDSSVKETLDYLREMLNQQVRVLGYTCQTGGGDELVWPRELSEEQVAPRSRPSRTQPRPSAPPSGPKAPSRSRPVPAGESTYSDQPTPTASAQTQPQEPAGFGPLSATAVTPKQKEILNRLIQLDGLGLVRKGLEYYLTSDELGATATVVLAVDPDRWPFPKPDEVIVVVNTGPAHMAGFLGITPREVEEFLGSLPRSDRREHKGSLLLRAANMNEAAQIVNELRALKEVTAVSTS